MRREIGLLLRELDRLAAATHDARAELLVEAGIDAVDRRVLDGLASGDRRTTTRSLALSLLCPASTIEASLSRLRRYGWIDEPAFQDGLHATHALTTAGRRWLGELQRQERAVDDLLDGDVQRDQLRHASRLLRAARRRLAARQRLRTRPR
ncbi:MAG TPA: hypothetical protein VFI92_08460, partial [Steroidobacteraceae bacterium]|nr:hypothetical protein [Steroidobacteraceae bacterium]